MEKQKRKYLNLNGNVNRTPNGIAITIFISDKLLEAVKRRSQVSDEVLGEEK